MSSIQKSKITPFLWFESGGKEAAEYYVSIFPDAKIVSSNPVVTVFEICGQRFSTLNGGPHDTFNDSISFYVNCEDQTEVDYFWNTFIKDGGTASQCGWLKDKHGVSWQIIPAILPQLFSNPDQQKVQKAMKAMFQMSKIIVADLEKAFNS